VVLYTVKAEENIYFNISTITAAIFLTLCLLLTLYAKYRESLRKSVFDSKKDKWKVDFENDLDNMMDNFFTPQYLQLVKNALSKEENKKALQDKTKTIKEILETEKQIWEKENKNQNDYSRTLFAENQGLKIQNMLDGAFSGPLKEKHAIVKYQIEIFSKKRFSLFVLGLLTFILSMGIKLFI
jgi:hypothetical protein